MNARDTFFEKGLLRLHLFQQARAESVNSAKTDIEHRKIMFSKPLLKSTYTKWYQEIKKVIGPIREARFPIIELGAGPSFLERYIPEVIKTEVIASPNTHRIIDAESLPFDEQSIGALILVNVFHHLAHPARFFKGAEHCLVRGGKIVMIEPSHSLLNRWIIKLLHPCEFYDESIQTWRNFPTGRLTGANNAMAWVVLQRDRKIFESRFRHLKINSIVPHTVLLLYLSGGYAFPSLVPKGLTSSILRLEDLLNKIVPYLGSHLTIEIEKV